MWRTTQFGSHAKRVSERTLTVKETIDIFRAQLCQRRAFCKAFHVWGGIWKNQARKLFAGLAVCEPYCINIPFLMVKQFRKTFTCVCIMRLPCCCAMRIQTRFFLCDRAKFWYVYAVGQAAAANILKRQKSAIARELVRRSRSNDVPKRQSRCAPTVAANLDGNQIQ